MTLDLTESEAKQVWDALGSRLVYLLRLEREVQRLADAVPCWDVDDVRCALSAVTDKMNSCRAARAKLESLPVELL